MKTCRLLSHRSVRPSAQILSDSSTARGGPQVCKRKAAVLFCHHPTAVALWSHHLQPGSSVLTVWENRGGMGEEKGISLHFYFSLLLTLSLSLSLCHSFTLSPFVTTATAKLAHTVNLKSSHSSRGEWGRDNHWKQKTQDVPIRYIRHTSCFPIMTCDWESTTEFILMRVREALSLTIWNEHH